MSLAWGTNIPRKIKGPVGAGLLPDATTAKPTTGGNIFSGTEAKPDVKDMGYPRGALDVVNWLNQQGYGDIANQFKEQPGVSDYFGDLFTSGGVAGGLGDAIGKGGYQPGYNESLEAGQKLLTGGAPGLDTAAGPSGINQMAAKAGGYDPNASLDFSGAPATGTAAGMYDVGGKALPTGAGASAGVTGPNMPGGSAQDLLSSLFSALGGTQAAGVGREGGIDVGPSTFQESDIFKKLTGQSQETFDAALGATAAGAGGIDIEALREALTDEESQVVDTLTGEAQKAALSRGMSGRGPVGQTILADALSARLPEMAAKREGMLMDAQLAEAQNKLAAGGQMGALSGQAGNLATQMAQILQSGEQFGTEAQLAERGQNIEQNRQGIEAYMATTGRLGETGGQSLAGREQDINAAINAYESETGRKAVEAGAVSDDARNYIDSYIASTSRTQGERQLDQGDVQNAIASYGEATSRGLGAQAAQQAAQQLGFDYNALDSDNQNRFNEVMADIYRTGGQITEAHNQALTDIYSTQMAGAEGLGTLEFKQGAEAGAQNIDFVNAMSGLLLGGAGAQTAENQQMLEALMKQPEVFADMMRMLLEWNVGRTA